MKVQSSSTSAYSSSSPSSSLARSKAIFSVKSPTAMDGCSSSAGGGRGEVGGGRGGGGKQIYICSQWSLDRI